MKALFSIVALTFAVAGLASAAPANKDCPVSGKPAKDSVTTTHNGKEVGFCCNGCKGKFEADPAKFEKKIK